MEIQDTPLPGAQLAAATATSSVRPPLFLAAVSMASLLLVSTFLGYSESPFCAIPWIIAAAVFYTSFSFFLYRWARCDLRKPSPRLLLMLAIVLGSAALSIGTTGIGLKLGIVARDQIFLHRLNDYNAAVSEILLHPPSLGPFAFTAFPVSNHLAPRGAGRARDINGVSTVVFLTGGTGFPPNEFGYMYTSDDQPGSPSLASYIHVRKKIAPHWFALHAF